MTEYPENILVSPASDPVPVSTPILPEMLDFQPMEDYQDVINAGGTAPDTESTSDTTSGHSMTTWSQHGILKPNLRYALVASKTLPSLPKIVVEALAHPGWKHAMLEELESIYQNHTWSLTRTIEDMNILGCRWVFTAKLNSNGSLNKHKACLVAKGFVQGEGVDFSETFSQLLESPQFK